MRKKNTMIDKKTKKNINRPANIYTPSPRRSGAPNGQKFAPNGLAGKITALDGAGARPQALPKPMTHKFKSAGRRHAKRRPAPLFRPSRQGINVTNTHHGGQGSKKPVGQHPKRSQKIFSPKPNIAPRTIEGRPPPCPRPRRHPHNGPLHSNETPRGKVTPKTTHAPQTTKTNTFSSPKCVFFPRSRGAWQCVQLRPLPPATASPQHNQALNGVETAERFSFQNSDTYRAQEKSFRMERLCHNYKLLQNWS